MEGNQNNSGYHVRMEEMSSDEYGNRGSGLHIHYDFAFTPFGEMLLATTAKGICFAAFVDDRAVALCVLKEMFPLARYTQDTDTNQQDALTVFKQENKPSKEIKLHLKGSDFQWKVWNALLKIPQGKLTTYGAIAAEIGNPKAFRAVGTAVGFNPIAYFIPCHRVICTTGKLGGYRWGVVRKTAIIAWEMMRCVDNRTGIAFTDRSE